VRVTATLNWGGYTTQLSSRLQDFWLNDALTLTNYIVQVRFDVQAAIADLNQYVGQDDGGEYPLEFRRWFVNPADWTVDGEERRQVVYSDVQDEFEAVAEGLDGTTTVYTDDPSAAEDYGYVPQNLSGVFIGLLYHSGTPLDQYGTVIHELTHLYGGTDDYGGYFLNPRAFELPNAVVVWVYQGLILNPTTDTLLNNADSYAGYLTQYYYSGPP
jgi:hypothetical protein